MCYTIFIINNTLKKSCNSVFLIFKLICSIISCYDKSLSNLFYYCSPEKTTVNCDKTNNISLDTGKIIRLFGRFKSRPEKENRQWWSNTLVKQKSQDLFHIKVLSICKFIKLKCVVWFKGAMILKAQLSFCFSMLKTSKMLD